MNIKGEKTVHFGAFCDWSSVDFLGDGEYGTVYKATAKGIGGSDLPITVNLLNQNKPNVFVILYIYIKEWISKF